MPGSSSKGIFLCYRREDAAPYARSLQIQLSQRIPDAQVFIDLDSIEPGVDFAEVIREAVDSCAVLVALIGHQWATLADEEGRRRVDNPDDYVRFEIQTALERGVRVIPVLVDGAKPLQHQQLPAELHKLARLNALELSYSRYEYDAGRLLDLIQRVLAAVRDLSAVDRPAGLGPIGAQPPPEQADRQEKEWPEADEQGHLAPLDAPPPSSDPLSSISKTAPSRPERRQAASSWKLDIGAAADSHGTRFTVWSTDAHEVDVLVYSEAGDDLIGTYHLAPDPVRPNYFTTYCDGVLPGSRYMYLLDRSHPPFPDPASRYQPLGVHGLSEVVDPALFVWSDHSWHGVDLSSLILYQVHVGAATAEGTFDALTGRLDAIQQLGATALLLMPVADFDGKRNWGYDGVDLFAPARTYGGPEGLRRLVNAAHLKGLGVILDVVFNHIGNVGNYLVKFSHDYFSDAHKTPWGDAFNLEGTKSRPVRDFFVANARYWAHEYHIDGLRFDTISAIKDDSELYIVDEIRTRTLDTLPPNRTFITIAEDEFNDPNLVRSRGSGGLALDAVYADDFHHQLMVALTKARSGYYADYSGSYQDIARTINDAWFFTGQPSPWRGPRPLGARADDVSAEHFVYCLENHDQVGNRPLGERLSHLADAAAYRAASALFLSLPFTPLLFMGQEWSASSPFFYFTDFSEEHGRKVESGRQDTLAELFPGYDRGMSPSPQSPQTFLRSKLRWEERTEPGHGHTLALYQELLKLRRSKEALYSGVRGTWTAEAVDDLALVVRLRGGDGTDSLLTAVSLTGGAQIDLSGIAIARPPAERTWQLLLDTEDSRFGGTMARPLAGARVFDMSRPRGLIFGLM